MRRREFLIGGAAVAWPMVARAQQANRVRRIGILTVFAEGDFEGQRRVVAFLKKLHDLGWAEGGNLQIDYRWAGSDPDRTRTAVADLVALNPEAILVNHALALPLLQRATRTIPIIFVNVSDPVAAGFVTSLAHPGGNMTGFMNAEFSWGEKLLETLKEVAPLVTRVAVILNPEQTALVGVSKAIEHVASSLGVNVAVVGVRDGKEIEGAIDAVAREPNGGLVVLPSAVTNAHRELIIAMTARHRLPAVYAFRFFVANGGLMSYGVDPADQYQQGAVYVDHILKGQKPGDLPVQLAIKYELAINLKTAKALGLTVPPKLLFTADEVIE